MKFTDGYWGVRKGVQLQNPIEIRDVELGEGTLTLYAAMKHVNHKGDTLNATLFTAVYSSPMPDVIRVQYTHHKGTKRKGPHYQLGADANFTPEATEDKAGWRLTSGNLSVAFKRDSDWRADFSFKGQPLTGSGYKGPAIIDTEAGGAYMREQLDLGIGEYVYGLGERFTPFVKNGQTVDIWNEDGGTSSEQAYKNVPFYLSNRSYGVFVNHPEHVSFEVASENVSRVQFSVPGQALDYFVIGGGDPKEVLANYTKLTGRPALPPAWSFGLWLTTSFTTSYDEATVNSFIDGMAERDLPLHVFHFDCFWMKEYQWTDLKWDPAVFPDPKGMLTRLKDKGLKICVWINSYIAQKSYLFDEGMEHGYLLMRNKDDVWQTDMWQAGMGLVDFTNPAAVRWFQGKLEELVDMGVDSFKTDFGERIPTDVVYHDGSDPFKMHNYYTQLYNQAVFEVLERKLGKGEAALFARSATAGGQQFPVHWGGDCSANYPSMAESLRGGLSLTASGFGFWSHDISGFESTATPDLYKRWTAFGMLSTHSRLHGNSSYRVPWQFDEEAVDVLRRFTKLKSTLMPYMFGAAVQAANQGYPAMRAMVLEFPHDPTCDFLDRQYMLGDSLLVAPIFNEAGEAHYYVPQGEGRWTDFLSGRTYDGGWVRERHDYFSLPLLARPNSLIAVGANDRRPDYDYADGVVLHAFELADGAAAEAVVPAIAGEAALTVRVARRGNELRVTAEGEANKPWSLLLRGIASASSAGAKAEQAPQGVRLTPEAGVSAFTVTLN